MRWSKKYWVLAGFLAVAVVMTVGILAGNINHTRADKNAINLIASPEEESSVIKVSEIEKKDDLTNATPSVTPNDIAYSALAASTAQANPGMKVEDENGVIWTYTATPIEIFHKEYGGDYPITVLTSDGDKLIAPGTTNKYDFSLKNTGNVKLSYKMWAESSIDPEGLAIPIEIRVKGADGKWIKGTDQDWEAFLALNDVSDEGTIGVNSYANYSLEWQWPYETGNTAEEVAAGDVYDTWLGNRAVEEDLSVKVILHVMACYDEQSSETYQTGDNLNVYIYSGVLLLALIILIILGVLYAKKRKQQKP